MAQKVQITLVDDIDGSDADETVTFGLDGVTYEIDLSHDKAVILRAKLDEYLKAGRRTGGRLGKQRGGPARQVPTGPSAAAIRPWAAANGLAVNDRGRIPGPIVEAFMAYERGDKAPLTELQQAAKKPADAAPQEIAPLSPEEAAEEAAEVAADAARRNGAVAQARSSAPAKKAAASRDTTAAKKTAASKRPAKRSAAAAQ